jgi:toxin CptA
MSHHYAPVVQYPIGAALLLRGAVAGVIALVGVVLMVWGLQSPSGNMLAPIVMASLLYILCAGIAAKFAWQLPRGNLHWDGRIWHWGDQALEADDGLCVHFDAQHCMLLSLRFKRQADVWLWLERRAAPAHWGDLRRAVYSRPKPNATVPQSHADADRGQA